LLLTEQLRTNGVPLFVIARSMTEMPAATFATDVEVMRVSAPWPHIHILEEVSVRNVLISMAFSLGCLRLLVRHRHRYDLVHFHGASIPLFLCLPALKLLGKKVIAKVAAANLGTEAGALRGRYWGAGTLLAHLMRGVDAFVAISDEIREGLLRDGVAPEKIHRLDNFVDTETFHPPAPGEQERLKAEFGYAGKTLALCAGRLVQRKGLDYLLQAWARVSPAYPEARLLILGEGPLRENLEALSRHLGVADSVAFRGGVLNVPEYLRAADLFVLPSLQEGMPNALLEAMGSGLACAATAIGGVLDVVEHGTSGLLCHSGDPEELSAVLERCLADGGLRRRLGHRAWKTIHESFSQNQRAADYLRLYAHLR
jgi:glycosyltransferase involved in cell wall biosynthesis